MRILMLFVIGFVVGCAAGIWAFNGIWMLIAAFGCVTIWIILKLLKSDKVIFKKISLLIIGAAIGLSWMFAFDFFFINPARQAEGLTYNSTIEVTDYSYDSTRGTCGKGKTVISGKTYKVFYYLADFHELRPGDRIKGSFSLRFTGFGGEQDPTYHQGSGIFLIAQFKGTTSVKHQDKITFKYAPVYLRKRITDKIMDIFPNDVSGFAQALLLGDTTQLDDANDAALKISGLRHVVAVSGLHISILMSFIFFFVRDRRFFNSLISIPVLMLFCAIAGFTPSVVRASVMQIIFIIGMETDKEYDAATSLSIAVLILVFSNPLVLTSVSFQLSVSCVVGILLFNGKIYNYLSNTKFGCTKGRTFKARTKRACMRTISITLSTMVTTLPFSTYYFGSISLISVLSNLLLLWLISTCFYGVAISCALGFMIPAVGSWIATVVSLLIRFVLFVARCLSRIPFASVSTNNLYIFLWVVFVYILLTAFLLCRKKKPMLFCGLAAAGLCFSIAFAYIEPRMDNYRVTVLDVGQGQCILIQSKDDCYVVDCGGFSGDGPADLAAQTLRTCGISKIDGLILTHFDDDHAGSVEAFLHQVEADYIYVPDADEDNDIRKYLEYQYSGSLSKVRKILDLKCGVGEITIYPGQDGANGNESSLCILFQADNCDILITGDRNTKGERYLIDQSNLPPIDILIVGHHGADSSTSLYLMQNLQPQTAVISVGKNNRYGHPDPVVINRLKNFNCTIWRTDQDGAIVFRG